MTNANEITYPARPVLIVDDEQAALSGIELVLESNGILNTISCQDSRLVMDILDKTKCSVVLLDLSMPGLSGEDLLPMIKARYTDLPVTIITGHNELETAISCMQEGAFDYMVKPVHKSRLTSSVRRAIEMNELKSEYAAFKDRVLTNKLDHPEVFEKIVTNNYKMHSMFQYMETIAVTPRPVFITGETGVGKELVAQAIHQTSGRAGPFVPVNVAGLDDNVFSDTLFGHLRGAFTGADRARQGLVQKAAGGTLFLDEIGDLEMSSQVKLLRLLQENEYYPLGADVAKMSDARIIVATNRTIADLSAAGDFRQDLYFRLRTHHVRIPPLRERMDDLEILMEHFLGMAAVSLEKKTPTCTREVLDLLANYSFPGNIRELEGMAFEAVSRHRSGVLSPEAFQEHLEESEVSGMHHSLVSRSDSNDTISSTLVEAQEPVAFGETLPTLNEVQELLILEALERSSGNQTAAAQLLGISRSGLSKAIKRKNIVHSS
jgi:DNA-binding NtrC family response regulator